MLHEVEPVARVAAPACPPGRAIGRRIIEPEVADDFVGVLGARTEVLERYLVVVGKLEATVDARNHVFVTIPTTRRDKPADARVLPHVVGVTRDGRFGIRLKACDIGAQGAR